MVGRGDIIRQPVYVRDIVRLTADVIDRSESFHKAFDIGGGTEVSIREFVLLVAAELGVTKTLLPIPKWAAKLVAYTLERTLTNPPFTSDNVLGLIESTDFDTTAAMQQLSFEPTPLREGLKRAIYELNENIV